MENKVEETQKAPKKAVAKEKATINYAEMKLEDLRLEIQKLSLSIKSGRETNTSRRKKMKKELARKLTSLSSDREMKN